MTEEMIMVSKRKVEVLKVFYAIFTVLMDADEIPQDLLIEKLRRLRASLRGLVSDADMN